MVPSDVNAGLLPLTVTCGREVEHQTQVPVTVVTSSRPPLPLTTISRPLGANRASVGAVAQVCGPPHTRRAWPVWGEASVTPLPDTGVITSCPSPPGNAADAGGAHAASARTVTTSAHHRVLSSMHSETV